VLYGPLCMIDVVRSSVMLPPLNVGESLAIRPAGAYNNTQWMQFIQYRPAVVMVTQGGKVEVIRAAEKLEDVSGLEEMPDTLRLPFPQGLPE
jgi:diaminopimelate decarboxylase